MSLSEIHARSPAIQESWLDRFRNQFNRSYTMELRLNHAPVPDSFLDLTPKLKHVAPERRRLTEVLTMPASMSITLWNLILEDGFPSLGPRVVTSLEDVRGRGNYMIIGNDDDFLFVWAPVYESTELFAKHWAILRYCFDKGLVTDKTRMWGVGETLRESDGIRINNFSGSFQKNLSESLFRYNVSERQHYRDLVESLSDKFNTDFLFFDHDFTLHEDHTFDDVGVNCPIIPTSLGEFDPEKCYRYNVLPGVFKNFSIYDVMMENQTYDDVFAESSPFVRDGRLDEFKREMYRLSRLV